MCLNPDAKLQDIYSGDSFGRRKPSTPTNDDAGRLKIIIILGGAFVFVVAVIIVRFILKRLSNKRNDNNKESQGKITI